MFKRSIDATLEAMRTSAIFCLLAVPLACASVPAGSSDWIEPAEAVRAANEDPAYGIRGHFVMTVRAIGARGDRTFFNSETDYRHQTNLTIVMDGQTAQDVARRLGVPLAEIKGRRIVVLGVARRARIDFIGDDGRASGKYYYQTHVRVDAPTQVEFAD